MTGCSAGIGRGIARELAAEGVQTVIVARCGELLATLADEIAATGAPRPFAVAIDLADRGAPDQIKDRVLAAFDRVDILINNAGGSRPFAVDAPDDAWDETFAVNFTALRKMTQAFLPGMQERGFGRIINITGTNEPDGVNGAAAAKFAVHAWAKGLSRVVGPFGITVNCLMPGRIHSEQIDERLHPTAESRAEFTKNIPVGYFGEPEDMAFPVVCLCSPRARYITGESIRVDGGHYRSI